MSDTIRVTGGLMIDYRNRADDLQLDLVSLRSSFRESFLPGSGKEDILDVFIDVFFPSYVENEYLFIKTRDVSDKGGVELSVRPSNISIPRFHGKFPQGLSPCIRGEILNSRNIRFLSIRRIMLVPYVRIRPFERSLSLVPISRDALMGESDARPSVLLSLPDELPLISAITAKKLGDWRAYLTWKEKLIRSRILGLRYLGRSFHNGYLRFVTAANSKEESESIYKRIRNEVLIAAPLRLSENEWKFSPKEDERIKGEPLGELVSCETMEGDIKGAEADNRYVAIVTAKLDDDSASAIEDAANDEERDAELRKIEAKIPENGFIACSPVGEMALLKRLRSALSNLEQEDHQAPFLSSYMFDITQAGEPVAREEISEYFFPELNDEQKEAVRKMLEAPDLCLVQGPPGTGKTTVIAEAIHQFARKGLKVLLASQANTAVDNALERLSRDPSVRVLRLVSNNENFDKMTEEAKTFTEGQTLGRTYQLLAGEARRQFIDRWDQSLADEALIKSFLEKLSFIENDVRKLFKRHSEADEGIKDIANKIEDEKTRLRAAEEQSVRIIAEKEQMIALSRFIRSDLTDGSIYLLPRRIAESFHSFVATGFFSVLQESPLSHSWDGWEIVSDLGLAKLVKEFLCHWDEVKKKREKMEALHRWLKELPGTDLISPDTAIRLRELGKRSAELEQEMESGDTGKIDDWKKCKAEIKRIKSEEGFDGALFEHLLDKESIGRISQDKDSATRLTESLVEGIKRLEPQMGDWIDNFLVHLDEEITKVKPVDSDNKILKKLEVEHKILANEIISCKEERKNRKKRLNEIAVPLIKRKIIANNDWTLENISDLRKEIESSQNIITKQLEGESDIRTAWEPIIREWVEDLSGEETSFRDFGVIGKDFLRNCNVVGMTCTQNTKFLRDAGHEWFDVVIIDEVSKATPPELVTSMMMARKTILVGDHRQLPPLFSEKAGTGFTDAINEAEESKSEDNAANISTELTEENRRRFEKMVTASLFKDHFEKASSSIKVSLFSQFRMHSQIMDIINTFYENKLRSGNETLDALRSHGLTILAADTGVEFLTPDRHAVWIDSSLDPDGKPFVEEQVGTGKINRLELMIISRLLEKIEEECSRLGHGRDLPTKQIGLISFYGQQVRELINVIRKKRFSAIKVELNTVDQFQGKEKPIIIVSMVRNKRLRVKSSQTHVAQFERINVAMSRAQELLVVVGAKEMFNDYEIRLPNMDRPGETIKKVYRIILDKFSRGGSLFASSKIISPQEYKSSGGSKSKDNIKEERSRAR